MKARAYGTLAAVLLVLFAGRSAHAQQRGSDVGGNPARRKVTKLPKLTTFVEADYPAQKKAAGIQADVVLIIEISAVGQVTGVTVSQSSGAPDFDAAAIAAAKQLVFEPAEVDDKPSPAKITYRYSFMVKAEASPPSPLEPIAPSARAQAPELPPPPPKPDDPAEVEVRGRPAPRREMYETSISANEARRVAGTQGDVLKVVQNLPGVSRPPVASGQIVVWGAAPRETRTYVDGVDLPTLYHGSGLRSVINSDLVSTIDLVPGAFGAEYGRGLGGLVRVETRSLSRGTHGYIGVDTLDASGMVSTELGDRVRVAVAGRQSWLDQVLKLVSAPDVGDFFPIPKYRDGQVKATIDLRRGESLDLVVLGSTDDLTRTVSSPDPASTRSEATHSGFWRAYARYSRTADDGDGVTLTPFFGRDSSRLSQQFGGSPATLDVTSTQYGFRGSLRSKINRYLNIVTGLDALGTASDLSRSGSLTLPAREGDISVFGQPPGDDFATDTWSTNILDVGPHAYADVRIGPLTVTPGVRADMVLIEGNRRTPRVPLAPDIGFSRLETDLEPKLSARWDITTRYSLNAAYGTYHQAPDAQDLSAVFGTPDLTLSRSTHITAGQSLRITPSLTADVVGFEKTMRDLVVRSRLPNPLLSRSLTQNGEGRSYGVQLLLRQELWKGFFGWVSYAISRSERRYEGIDERWRLFDFDQPHVLSVVASQEIGHWGFGARFRYASGNPRTPVIGSSYDSRNDRYDPELGVQNTARIPAFWQLDIRVERSFQLGEYLRLQVYADVQNVTNRDNPEEVVYTPSFRQRGTITGLPTIAVIGARLEL